VASDDDGGSAGGSRGAALAPGCGLCSARSPHPNQIRTDVSPRRVMVPTIPCSCCGTPAFASGTALVWRRESGSGGTKLMSDGIAQAKGIVSVRGGVVLLLLVLRRTSSTAISGAAADCGKASLAILRNLSRKSVLYGRREECETVSLQVGCLRVAARVDGAAPALTRRVSRPYCTTVSPTKRCRLKSFSLLDRKRFLRWSCCIPLPRTAEDFKIQRLCRMIFDDCNAINRSVVHLESQS